MKKTNIATYSRHHAHDCPPSSSRRACGRLVARILSMDRYEEWRKLVLMEEEKRQYEKADTTTRKDMVTLLTQQLLTQKLRSDSEESSQKVEGREALHLSDSDFRLSHDDSAPDSTTPHLASATTEEKWVVSIDISIRNDDNNTSKKAGPLEIHLMRDANEDISRTLSRMELSVAKKLGLLPKSQSKKKTKTKSLSPPPRRPAETNERQGHRRAASFSNGIPDDGTRASQFVLLTENGAEKDEEEEWNVSNLLTAQVWKDVAEKKTFQKLVLRLALPQSPSSSATDSDEMSYIELEMESCPPTVTSVQTFGGFDKARVFANIPLAVSYTADESSTDETLCGWFVDGQLCLEGASNSRPVFVPTTNDIGKRLGVILLPIRRQSRDCEAATQQQGRGHDTLVGTAQVWEFQNLIEERPTLDIPDVIRQSWIHEERHENDNGGRTFRLLTYNILADSNATRNGREKFLYPWCDPALVVKERRFPLIVSELLSYRAHVICLQEVDIAMYEQVLRPILVDQDGPYDGAFSTKASSVSREGLAMFWSRQMFVTEDSSSQAVTYALKDILAELCLENSNSEKTYRDNNDDWSVSDRDIAAFLDQHPNAYEMACQNQAYVVQVAKLAFRKETDNAAAPCLDKICQQQRRPPPSGVSQYLVLGNAHLCGHPLSTHVRILQGYAYCRALFIARQQCGDAPIVLCGDLNDVSASPFYQLLMGDAVQKDNIEAWRHVDDYRVTQDDGESDDEDDTRHPLLQEDDPESAPSQSRLGLTLQLPLVFPRLQSAFRQEEPKFSFFQHSTKAATVDHVLLGSSSSLAIDLCSAAPMPTAEQVGGKYIGMMNEAMPSDHVGLLCDLQISAAGARSE